MEVEYRLDREEEVVVVQNEEGRQYCHPQKKEEGLEQKKENLPLKREKAVGEEAVGEEGAVKARRWRKTRNQEWK